MFVTQLVSFNDFFVFSDDFNRVVLDTIEGEHDSDYINASYVDVSSFSTSLVLTVKILSFLEPIKTECLHSYPRSYRRNSNGFLENGMAGKGKLHCDVN